MLQVQRITSPSMAHVHRHAHHELIRVVDGTYRVEVDGVLHALAAGGSALYPAGTLHRPILRFDVTVILVQWDGSDPPLRELPRIGADRHGALRQTLLWLEAWCGAPEVPEGDRRALLRVALRHHAGGGTATVLDPLTRARRQLEETLDMRLTLEGLAANVGMSRAQLGRRFRAAYGLSPMAYRRQVRLDRALDLLRAGGMTVEAVAHEVGYATAAHLSNLLKGERGLRPREIGRDRCGPRRPPSSS